MANLQRYSQNMDAMALLNRQREAFLQSDASNLKQRKGKLLKLRNAVQRYGQELEEAVNQDFSHRSRHETRILELAVVVQAINYLIRNLRRFMKPERRHVGLFYKFGRAYVEYQPLGVIGIMAPWNYPISLTLIPLATALAAGNRAILKPSEVTSRTSEVLVSMLGETFNKDEVAVVLGGAELGAYFSGLPFDHLFFTGSTPVGRKVMNAASQNLVPVTLELGGKSPVVVGRGQVNARHLDSIVFGKLSNGGQTCVAPDYAFVHKEDVEAFIEQFSESVKRFYPEGPVSKDYTSIVSDRHFERLSHLIEQAKQNTRVVQVGHQPESAESRQRTLAPTLVVGADDDLALMREEIFGPILPIRIYDSMEEVIDYINQNPRPLALYYFGRQDDDSRKLLNKTTSGNVGVNHTILHVAQEDLPFGGVGASGMGAYHGIEGFRALSHAKGVFVQSRWNMTGLVRAPFGKLADIASWLMMGVSLKSKKAALNNLKPISGSRKN